MSTVSSSFNPYETKCLLLRYIHIYYNYLFKKNLSHSKQIYPFIGHIYKDIVCNVYMCVHLI